MLSALQNQNPALPVLRPDIQFMPGPKNRRGAPTFTIYDPLQHTYHKVNWPEATILKLLGRPQTLDRVMGHLLGQTSLRVDPNEVMGVCQQASAMGLTMESCTKPVRDLLAEREARKIHPLVWLVHHYIFFRVPLLWPENFLRHTLPYVKFLASRGAIYLYLLASILGLGLVAPQAERYLKTFTYFFNLQGLFWYALAIAAVKAVHEFSHAYVATHYGARVTVMGMAFIVFWPLAYSDITDAWRIASRKKRAIISSAGVAAELVIAGLALLGWAFTKPGPLNSVFFVLSSSTLLATLVINLNPGMRWDGYYLLMDLWGIDNLQSRSFSVTLWYLRKKLLGVNAPCPEEYMSGKRLAGMIIYSVYSWLYRFFLYLGIAILIYHQFAKALGVLLFSVEVGWFILKPLGKEIYNSARICRRNKLNKKMAATLVGCGLILTWLILPLPRSFEVPAVVMARETQSIYAPFSGKLEYVGVRRESEVRKGEILIRIGSKELKAELASLREEKRILIMQKDLLVVSGEDRSLLPQKQEEIEAVEAKIVKLENKISQNELTAELNGMVEEWDENVAAGQFVAQDQVFGKIVGQKNKIIYAFVNEDELHDLHANQAGAFYPSDGSASFDVCITKVSPVREETIRHPALTSMAKGSLPVSNANNNGNMIILGSYYLVEAKINDQGDSNLRIGQSGEVKLTGEPASLIMEAVRYVFRMLLRESNF